MTTALAERPHPETTRKRALSSLKGTIQEVAMIRIRRWLVACLVLPALASAGNRSRLRPPTPGRRRWPTRRVTELDGLRPTLDGVTTHLGRTQRTVTIVNQTSKTRARVSFWVRTDRRLLGAAEVPDHHRPARLQRHGGREAPRAGQRDDAARSLHDDRSVRQRLGPRDVDALSPGGEGRLLGRRQQERLLQLAAQQGRRRLPLAAAVVERQRFGEPASLREAVPLCRR